MNEPDDPKHRPLRPADVRASAKVAEIVRSLADRVEAGTSLRNVYGDPVKVGGRTVIPIARVSFAFGAGGGAKGRKKATAEGGGGGAGISSRPVGALEITEAETRFIRFTDPARLATGLLAGLLLGVAIGRLSARRARRPRPERAAG